MTEQVPETTADRNEDVAGFPVQQVVRPPGHDSEPRVVSRDETDLGWGDAPGERDEDWYRRERPPHHE